MEHFYENIPGFMSANNIKCFDHIISKIKNDNITWVELGSYGGKSTAYCVVELLKHKYTFDFYCIDLWKNGMQETFEDQIIPIKDHIVWRKNFSHAEANNFQDASIDICYVDADHSYESVKKDLNAWWPKLKPGAVFFGDDYTKGFPGVGKAVKEFFTPKNIRVTKIGRCWVVTKPK